MQLPDGRRNKVTGLVKLPSDLLGRKLVEVASEVQGVDGNDLSAAPLPVVPGETHSADNNPRQGRVGDFGRVNTLQTNRPMALCLSKSGSPRHTYCGVPSIRQ